MCEDKEVKAEGQRDGAINIDKSEGRAKRWRNRYRQVGMKKRERENWYKQKGEREEKKYMQILVTQRIDKLKKRIETEKKKREREQEREEVNKQKACVQFCLFHFTNKSLADPRL